MGGRRSGLELGIAVALALVAVLGGLLVAAPWRSSAVYYPPQCGGDHVIEPRHHPPHEFPPLAIGDSTMLLAAYNLADAGFEVDAQGCREYGEALQILERRRAAGTLPHMVVIALGADGSVSSQDIGHALGLLCCTHLLVLVTPRELGGGSGSDAVVTRDEVARHPGRARLLDWVRYSAGHGEWFQPDGLHLTDVGAIAFTRLLRQSLRFAYPPQPPAWTRWREARCSQGAAPAPPARDTWPAAGRRLVPHGFIGMRLCRYGARLAGATVVHLRAAGALAHDLDGLRASGGGACVGAAKPIVAHLAYPGRRSVTVWVGTAGCRYAINGALTRPASSSVVHELERLAG